jgi:hypothetical protein
MVRRRKSAQPKTARGGRSTRSKDLEKPRPSVGRARGQPFERALAAVGKLADAIEWPCAVIGGVAVIAHGFARATADIDLAVVAGTDDIIELVRIAGRVGIRPRIKGAEAFGRENLVLLLKHAATGVPVDLSLALQAFEKDAAEHAVVRKLGSTAVRVAPLNALFIYKMVAGRPKDIDDVRALMATRAPFDARMIERTLAEFDALLETDRTNEFRKLVDGRY